MRRISKSRLVLGGPLAALASLLVVVVFGPVARAQQSPPSRQSPEPASAPAPASAAPHACKSTLECSGEDRCEAGTCTPPPRPLCVDSSTCGAEETCVHSACEPRPAVRSHVFGGATLLDLGKPGVLSGFEFQGEAAFRPLFRTNAWDGTFNLSWAMGTFVAACANDVVCGLPEAFGTALMALGFDVGGGPVQFGPRVGFGMLWDWGGNPYPANLYAVSTGAAGVPILTPSFHVIWWFVRAVGLEVELGDLIDLGAMRSLLRFSGGLSFSWE